MRLALDGRTPGALWARRCESARRSYAPICRIAAVLLLLMGVAFLVRAESYGLLLILVVLGSFETARDLWNAALPFHAGRLLRRVRGRRRLGTALST